MLCDCMFLYRNVVRTNIESYYQSSTDYFSYKLTSSGDVFFVFKECWWHWQLFTDLLYGELGYSVMACSSCSTSSTRRGILVTIPVISQEWGMYWIKITTNGNYPWSFVTNTIKLKISNFISSPSIYKNKILWTFYEMHFQCCFPLH